MKAFLIVISFFSVTPAWAGLFAELNAYYATDTFTTETTSSDNKMFYALDIYANLENKNRIFAGFHVDQVALTETQAGSTSQLTSLNMGLMALWVMDKRKIFSWAAGYNLVANGSYQVTGETATTLTGTSLFSTLAAMPEIGENLYFGLKLNYYSLNYTKASVSTTTTDVSYNRTLIFPSISLAFRY